jgi:hypothetical protein
VFRPPIPFVVVMVACTLELFDIGFHRVQLLFFVLLVHAPARLVRLKKNTNSNRLQNLFFTDVGQTEIEFLCPGLSQSLVRMDSQTGLIY